MVVGTGEVVGGSVEAFAETVEGHGFVITDAGVVSLVDFEPDGGAEDEQKQEWVEFGSWYFCEVFGGSRRRGFLGGAGGFAMRWFGPGFFH